MFPVDRIRSERASLSVQPSPPFDAAAHLRRFTTPSPYSGLNSATDHSTVQPSAVSSYQEHGIVPSSKIPSHAAHTYILTSRGRDYATIVVASRAPNIQDPPVLHFGDELNGLIVLPRDNLSDMRSMEVVFQLFGSDNIIPSFESKRTLLSQQVDESCISGGQFIWPFDITPPPVPSSSSSSTAASSHANPSLTYLSPRGRGNSPRVLLMVTIYRRGRLTRNVVLKKPIHYVPPPDPVIIPSPSLLSTELSSSTSGESRGLAVNSSSLPQQEFPTVIVKGVMFGQSMVKVECKLTAPVSHPVSDVIPLSLVMTSETRQALDLLAVPHAINVRLLSAMVFGENPSNVHPFTLRNRSSYHRTDWAADARWGANALSWEISPSVTHPQTRWCIKLDGKLHRVPKFEMSESNEQPGMAIMYFVCLFPFSSKDFSPASDPKKELLMGKITITGQR